MRPAPDDQLRLHPQPREGGIHPGDEIRLLTAVSVLAKLGPLARENGSSVEVNLAAFGVPCYDFNPIGNLIVVADFVDIAKFMSRFLHSLIFWPSV